MMRLRSRGPLMSLIPSGVQTSWIRQCAVPDVRRWRERYRLLHHGRRGGQYPGDLQEPLGFLRPRRRPLPVEFAKVLDRGGQQRIPSGAGTRGPFVHNLLLLFSSERSEVPGQVVQDRPCEVSTRPPGADRVRVVAECDAGWRARMWYRVHRRLVRSRRLQPTVRLRRRSTRGEPALELGVWRPPGYLSSRDSGCRIRHPSFRRRRDLGHREPLRLPGRPVRASRKGPAPSRTGAFPISREQCSV